MRTARQPANVVFPLVFPMLLLAVNAGGLKAATNLPGFPTDSFLAFALAVPFVQGALLATINANVEFARDIQTGFLNRLALTPVRGIVLLLGQLGGLMTIAARSRLSSTSRSAIAFGVRLASGVGGAVMLLVLEIVIALGFASLGSWAALRTGSTEAVQGLFPVFFVFLFLSSMNMPRNLIEADWFRWVATVNPVSYLDRGGAVARDRGVELGSARARLRGGRRAQPGRVRARGACTLIDGWSEHEGHTRRRTRRVVARAAHVLHEPGVPAAVARVPALLLHGVRRRAVAHLAGAGLRLPDAATRRSSSCSCCCSRPRSPACSRASASHATSRADSCAA